MFPVAHSASLNCTHKLSADRLITVGYHRHVDDEIVVVVPLQPDDDGYIDRQCPAEACGFVFKVYNDDWSDLVGETVFCPACRNQADNDEWSTDDQIESAQEAALQQATHAVLGSLQTMAEEFNRAQPRNAFIQLRMEVDDPGPQPVILPIAAVASMTLRAQCSECQCRYSFIGAAFFCPACGHNCADRTFSDALDRIRASVGVGDKIEAAFERDLAAQVMRSLLEGALEDLVTAFQRVAESWYERLTSSVPPRNAFQNLKRGGELWERATGCAYETLVSQSDLERLRVYFQRRHVLAHRDGIVDEDYVNQSGDATYQVGQKLVVKRADAEEMAQCVERLATAMRALLPT